MGTCIQKYGCKQLVSAVDALMPKMGIYEKFDVLTVIANLRILENEFIFLVMLIIFGARDNLVRDNWHHAIIWCSRYFGTRNILVHAVITYALKFGARGENRRSYDTKPKPGDFSMVLLLYFYFPVLQGL